MKTLLFSAATVALFGMTACSGSDDNIIGDEPAQDGKVYYRISIPATIGGDAQTRAVTFDANGTDITTTFKTTDIIHAYNKTQGYFYVSTFSPNANAKNANLMNGDAYWLGDAGTRWNLNDEILLMYNLSQPGGGTNSYFQYDGNATIGQLGTAASASEYDFAVATITVTGKTGTGTEGDPYVITTSVASFTNLGSMFRQRFTFADADDNPIATPTVTKLVISDANTKITNLYYPMKAAAEQDHVRTSGIFLTNPDLSGDVYWAMRFAGEAGKITFLAYTNDGKVYEGSKNAPAAGFANGKYYHSNTPVTMKPSTSVVPPTVTGSYSFNTTYNRCDIEGDATISGESRGWYFDIDVSATLTLDHASLYKSSSSSGAEYCSLYTDNMTFNLQGDNTIMMFGGNCGIFVNNNNTTVTMTGSGTLSIICKGSGSETNGGFYLRSGLSIVAADGHTLSLTTTANSDDTYTHTWTVTPNN